MTRFEVTRYDINDLDRAITDNYATGKWKRAHVPQKLLQWVEKYH